MEKENKKWNNLSLREKRSSLLLFASVLLIGALGLLFYYLMDNQPQDYTIGTIDDIYAPARGGRLVSFTYYVNGQEFQSSGSIHGFENIARVGKKFLVEFPEEYPWRGLIHLETPINDTISAPEKGWDEIPEPLKRIN